MSTIQRYPTPMPVPFSKAVRAGGFLFVSGQLAMDASANILHPDDVVAQTRAVLERIAATLQECGASMADVVKTTVFLGNLDDFAAFNEEYRRHFTLGLPARSTVECKLYRKAKVEIEVQAFAPQA
jgi:2-iminobutanoate/2-iminopropanoate deaminase